MRSVNTAIWTSEEPESVSWRRADAMAAALICLSRGMALSPVTGGLAAPQGRRRTRGRLVSVGAYVERRRVVDGRGDAPNCHGRSGGRLRTPPGGYAGGASGAPSVPRYDRRIETAAARST